MKWRAKVIRMLRAARAHGWDTVIVGVYVVFVVAVLAISGLGYVLRLEWIGVTEKTFWHWPVLVFTPILLSGGGFLLYKSWDSSDHRAKEKEAHEAARHADLDKITLGYLNDIEQLLLEADSKHHREETVCAIARARTLNVLEGLDEYRKGSIVLFLYDASLLTHPKSSKKASNYNIFVQLNGANLRRAQLRQADLSGAYLSGADLSYANLRGANLSDAHLCEADLGTTNLGGAILIKAHLKGADLEWADLNGANLTDADLRETNFCKAYLGNATVTQKQLDQAASLKGSSKRTGQTYEEWLQDKKIHEQYKKSGAAS
jgi:hypothetical protein